MQPEILISDLVTGIDITTLPSSHMRYYGHHPGLQTIKSVRKVYVVHQKDVLPNFTRKINLKGGLSFASYLFCPSFCHFPPYTNMLRETKLSLVRAVRFFFNPRGRSSFQQLK